MSGAGESPGEPLRCDEHVLYHKQPGVVTTFRLVNGRQVVRVRLFDAEGRPYGECIEGPSKIFQRVSSAPVCVPGSSVGQA